VQLGLAAFRDAFAKLCFPWGVRSQSQLEDRSCLTTKTWCFALSRAGHVESPHWSSIARLELGIGLLHEIGDLSNGLITVIHHHDLM
jgi:hypothetical protein